MKRLAQRTWYMAVALFWFALAWPAAHVGQFLVARQRQALCNYSRVLRTR